MTDVTDVTVVGASFAFAQQSSLLQDINLNFSAGWTGVVGANGSGKSTLLKLLTGALQPTSGTIVPPGRYVTYQTQELLEPEEIAHFAWEWSKEGLRWLSLLSVDPESFERWEVLSAGERRRWQLAMAFRYATDVLILDEPTNHLDSEGRDVLIEAMRSYRGVGILVSHDRTLLNAITTSTVRLNHNTARVYPAPYSEAKLLWDAEAVRELEELNRAQDHARALQTQLNQAASRHESSKRGLSTGRRMKSIHDSDARAALAKGRAESAEARIGQARGALSRAVSRANEELKDLRRPIELGEIFWEPAQSHRRSIARLEDGFELFTDSRIWLRGPNGCGKSTLIRRLIQALTIPVSSLVHITQEPERDPIFEVARSHTGEQKSKMLHAAAALGLDVRIFLDELPASPGQLKKLALAEGLVRNPILIVLDEPTNDLDIDGIERLERALLSYLGALILVTHDDLLGESLQLEVKTI